MSSQAEPPSTERNRRLPLLAALALVVAGLVYWTMRGGAGRPVPVPNDRVAADLRSPGGAAGRPPAPNFKVAAAAAAADAECQLCKKQRCPKGAYQSDCASLAGSLAAGPAAGKSKADACSAALTCVQEAGCANGVDVQPCYCGVGVADVACLTGGAKGPCKQVLEEAAETAHPERLAERFAQPEYAIAQAVYQVRCETNVCKTECTGR